MRRVLSLVVFGGLLGLGVYLPKVFVEGYTREFYAQPNPYLNRANSCPEPVSMLDAYNNELLADAFKTDDVMLCFCR